MVNSPEHAFQEALNELFKQVRGLNESLQALGDSIPAPDQNIERIDSEVHDLDTILKVFDAAAKKSLADLQCSRNQLLPIYGLPPEILLLIVDFVVDSELVDAPQNVRTRYTNHYKVVGQLAQISSLFRAPIISTSRFWTKIDDRFSPLFVELILQRSQNAPLEISIDYREEGSSDDDGDGALLEDRDRREDLYTNVLRYCSRWRSFRMRAPSFPTFGDQWLNEGNMPLLERLEVSSYSGSFIALPKGVTEHALKLSYLNCASFDFPLGCSALTRLESICMTSAINGVALSLSQWQLFLSSSPQIRGIAAYGNGNFESHSGDSRHVRIYMPKLQMLALHLQSLTLIGSLLCCIIPSENSYPKIFIGGLPQNSEEGWLESFPELAPDESLLSTTIRKLEWIQGERMPDNRLRLNAGISNKGSLITIEAERNRADVIQMLIPSFGAQCLYSVQINQSDLFASRDFASGIRHCPKLVGLVLDEIGEIAVRSWLGRRDSVEQVCLALATPLQLDMGSGVVPSWPCPNLRFLEIGSNGSHFPSVLQLIKTRYETVDQTSGASPHPPPVFLELLRLQRPRRVNIRSKNPREVEELEAMLKRNGTFLETVSQTAR